MDDDGFSCTIMLLNSRIFITLGHVTLFPCFVHTFSALFSHFEAEISSLDMLNTIVIALHIKLKMVIQDEGKNTQKGSEETDLFLFIVYCKSGKIQI